MVTMQTKTNFDSRGWDLGGRAVVNDDVTILQDAAKSVDLAFLTVLARATASQKMIALTDIDPALTPGIMTCGAIGGTAAEFAALASSSFKIGIDGEAVFEVVCDFTGLDTILDTPGSYLCGTNGAIIAAGWDAIADGAGTFPIDGVDVVLAAMDFTDCLTFWDVEETINHHAAGRFTVTYDGDANAFQIISPTSGELSTVAALSAGAGGTDITAAGYLNGTVAGAATAGTGGEGLFESLTDIINAELAGRATVAFDGDAFVFMSPTAGAQSAVSVLTAGATGTDISGASYLNGLTAVGTITASSGDAATAVPAGIFGGPTIAKATIIAGDVEDQKVMTYGEPKYFNEDEVVLENSLTFDDINPVTGKDIRTMLRDIGLIIVPTSNTEKIAPV